MHSLPAVLICNATTKAGERCTRPVGENGLQCWRHAEETRELARQASEAGAAKRDGKVSAALRERIESEPSLLLDPILRALTATKSYQQNGQVVEVPDHATQLKAVELVYDRVYGKPTQTTEVTGADGGPLITLLKIAAERGI